MRRRVLCLTLATTQRRIGQMPGRAERSGGAATGSTRQPRMVRRKLSTTLPGNRRAYLEWALDGATLLLQHEIDALSGHWVEVGERLALARKSRGLGDLVRNQVDLLPETRLRLLLDQHERKALLHSWWTDLVVKRGRN